MSGKTGTAQVISFSADKIFSKCENQEYRFRHHGLFTAYAPSVNPKIAVAVVVEHGCHGGSAAGPVARAMVSAYMNKYYPKYQEKLIAEDKMTFEEAIEDNRVNPFPMVPEANPVDFYDEQGVLVRNYVLTKDGKRAPLALPTEGAGTDGE